jgi:hypothetical protein
MEPLVVRADAPVQVAEHTAPAAAGEPQPQPATPPALRQPELIPEAMGVARNGEEAERVPAELEDVFTIRRHPGVLRNGLRLVQKGLESREAALRLRFPGLAAAVAPPTTKEGEGPNLRRRTRVAFAVIGTVTTRLLIRGARSRR